MQGRCHDPLVTLTSPQPGEAPGILWVQKSNQGSFQTKLLPIQESLV